MCQHCQKPENESNAEGVGQTCATSPESIISISPLVDPRKYGLNFLPKDELIDIIINLQNEREAADRATSLTVIGIVAAIIVIAIASIIGQY